MDIVGTGRTATIYDVGNGKVLKLFKSFCDKSSIENEFRFAKTAKEHGIQTPEAYSLVEDDRGVGIYYDRLEGIDLGASLGKNVFRIKSLAQNAASLLWSIHQIEDKSANDWRKAFSSRLETVKQLNDVDKGLIADYIQSLPKGCKLCHGDLHVENYLYDGDRLSVIDWMGAHYGHPAGDVARVVLLMSSPVIAAEAGIFERIIVKRILGLYNRAYIHSYLELSDMNYEQIEAFRLPVAALRLAEEVPYEEEWLKSIIGQEIKRRHLLVEED
ncbi:MAG: phosphotransferase [Spirochaetales bacterium]|nr:phosphotransferase [Spirochaetales bacterium]